MANFNNYIQNKLPQESLDQDAALWVDVRNSTSSRALDDLSQSMLEPDLKIAAVRFAINRVLMRVVTIAAVVPFGVSTHAITSYVASTSSDLSVLWATLPNLVLLGLLHCLEKRFTRENRGINLLFCIAEDMNTVRAAFHLKILAIMHTKLAENFGMEYTLFYSFNEKNVVIIGDEVSVDFQVIEKAVTLIKICDAYGEFLCTLLKDGLSPEVRYTQFLGFHEMMESLTILKVKGRLMENQEVMQKADILIECLDVLQKLLTCYEEPVRDTTLN